MLKIPEKLVIGSEYHTIAADAVQTIVSRIHRGMPQAVLDMVTGFLFIIGLNLVGKFLRIFSRPAAVWQIPFGRLSRSIFI
jgi:hypothetical protein